MHICGGTYALLSPSAGSSVSISTSLASVFASHTIEPYQSTHDSQSSPHFPNALFREAWWSL